ncbi:MAG: DUF1552 domain-containing protein, partial [Planctomycetes bacterium]|nr:DUF1552 domain-containing protein [Planctomycetota bacterium]
MNRRTFFRGATLGLGGVYLAPFIQDVNAAAKSSIKPARVVFVVQGNGVYPREITPGTIHMPKNPGTLEDRKLSSHKLPLSMEPLSPWVKKMTMIHGLSGRIARGSHNSGFAALGCWPFAKKAYGKTIDAEVAANLGGVYKHIGLGVYNKPSSIGYTVTSFGRGKAGPSIFNPLLAHRQYFAAGASGDSLKEFNVDTSLLDFLSDDVKRMQKTLDSSERNKLERYLEAFDAMNDRQSQLAKMSKKIAQLTPKIDPKLGNITGTKTGKTGIFDRLEAQMDIAAATLIAGLTNTVTISAGAGPDRIGLSCHSSELGKVKGAGSFNAHEIGHGRGTAGLSPAQCHAVIRRTCMEKLAKLIKKLEAIPEGNGTMMDNTLIVYMSDSAEGHHPVNREWPFVLIGDLGGRLKLGDRYLRYPWYGKTGHRT